jgi:hypothetical protein
MQVNTENLSDEEFDDYLRNTLQDTNNTKFRSEAWAHMEQMLNQSPKAQSTWGAWLRWSGLGMLCFAGIIGSVVLWTNKIESNKLTLNKNHSTQNPKNEVLRTWSKNKYPINQNTQKQNAEKEKTSENYASIKDNVQKKNPDTNPANTKATQREGILNTPKSIIINSSAILFADTSLQKSPIKKPSISPSPSVIYVSQGIATRSKGGSSILILPNNAAVKDNKLPDLNLSPFQETTTSAFTLADSTREKIKQKILVLTQSVQDSSKKRQTNQYNRLAVNFQFLPELNYAGNVNNAKVGWGVGILGEYFILPRLSSTLGVQYSYNPYRAGAEDYTPTRPWEYEIDKINAACKIINIPIGIRYYFSDTKLFNLFTSAQISSYFMLNEKYSYTYPYNGYLYERSWEVKNENKHFLSVAELSIGIEKALNNRLSFQFQPYFKLPLGGIGAGKVRLNSAGIYFNLKWTLGKLIH